MEMRGKVLDGQSHNWCLCTMVDDDGCITEV